MIDAGRAIRGSEKTSDDDRHVPMYGRAIRGSEKSRYTGEANPARVRLSCIFPYHTFTEVEVDRAGM